MWKPKVMFVFPPLQVLLNCLVALVIFVGLWWQSFIFSCAKFIIGYGVGAWYFAVSVLYDLAISTSLIRNNFQGQKEPQWAN